MITSGVVILVALVVLAIVLAFVFKQLGISSGFVAVSWVPLASLLMAIAFRRPLGRLVLAVVMSVAVVSVFMVGTGIMLTIQAKREGSGSLARLVIATVLAGIPLLLGIVMMGRSKGV